MSSLGDNPIIKCYETTGHPPWEQPKEVRCEACGKDLMKCDSGVYEDNVYEFLCMDCLLNLHEKAWW